MKNNKKLNSKINWSIVIIQGIVFGITAGVGTAIKDKLEIESFVQTLLLFTGCYLVAFVILVIIYMLFKKDK